MARPCRLQGENLFYHITSRGDGKKNIYLSEFDYKKFLGYLLKAKEKYNFYLYAYVLMTNHFHLFIETLQPNLSKIMQYINTSYTIYYNIKRNQTGHLFQGRYKSILVDTDNYFLSVTRYIHLNPVLAKMVKFPEEYQWSSYGGYLSRKGDGYIDKDQIKNHLDMSGEQYRQFVLNGISEKDNPFKNVYAGCILGTKQFITEKLDEMKDQMRDKDVSYKKDVRRSPADKGGILKLVGKKYSKSVVELRTDNRRPMTVKKIAIYLMKRLTELKNVEIGRIFGMNAAAVSKAAISIERKMETDKALKRDVMRLVSSFEV